MPMSWRGRRSLKSGRLLRPACFAPVSCAVNDVQDGEGLMVLGFIAQGIGDDVGQVTHDFFVGAGHAALASRGRGGESLNGSIEADGDVARGGRIVLRDISDDAAKIIVGVPRPYDSPHRLRLGFFAL